MSTVSGVVSRLRRPEYVGENRCVPCTIANVGIAAVASLAVGAGVAVGVSQATGVAAGGLLLGACLAAIYLRGYLVPGTPELTKRYFPQSLLGVFGKEPVIQDDAEGDVDQERVLVGVGALEVCRDGEDLCLVDDFREAWYAEMERVAAEDDYGGLLSIVGVDSGSVTVDEHGQQVQPQVDGRFAGVWKSRAALRADVAGAAVLSDRIEGWADLDPHDRHALLAGLRLFTDECPACGATPTLGVETVETCCASRDVTALECPDCGARLFETAVE
jgi:hypothetical protein